jgi:hypothetical protein
VTDCNMMIISFGYTIFSKHGAFVEPFAIYLSDMKIVFIHFNLMIYSSFK